jgi:hypothetical protein
MTRILLVGQDKGGSGKSTAVRALAEAIPNVDLIEVDIAQRLIEFDAGKPKAEKHQVRFFPMRADRQEIEKSGGKAARAEFDGVVDALASAKAPTVVDIGANTSASLFSLLAELAPHFGAAGIEIGVLIVVTAEPGALSEAPKLISLAKPWASSMFLLENRMRGDVDPKQLTKIAQDATISSFDEQVMEPKAVEILQDRGMRDIPNIDQATLTKLHGLALGARIQRDLARFRLGAMEAVKPAALWLIDA